MGIIFSRFRKEKTTFQKLEVLEEKIKNIEAYTINTQRRQKRVVGNILVISVGLYVIAFLVYYFLFFPPSAKERILHATPLFLFPIVVVFLRRFVSWYFQRKVNNNSKKLTDMRAEKKKLLETVMEKETYKVAVEILNRFGEKPIVQQRTIAPVQNQSSVTKSTVVQKPAPNTPLMNSSINRGMSQSGFNISSSLMPQGNMSNQGRLSLNQSVQNLPRSMMQSTSTSSITSTPLIQPQLRLMSRPTPFPVINFETKGVVEKMVDFLIGDGPSNRFAMICKECHRHNGMALEEEFYYTPFTCVYCSANNPARKLRPSAPQLPSVSDLEKSNLGVAKRLNFPTATAASSSSSSETEESGEIKESVPTPEIDKNDEHKKEEHEDNDIKNEETVNSNENNEVESEQFSTSQTLNEKNNNELSDNNENVDEDDVEIINKDDILENMNKTEIEKKND